MNIIQGFMVVMWAVQELCEYGLKASIFDADNTHNDF